MIVVLLVSYTVVTTVQGISFETGHETVGQVAGIFSPYTLVNGVQVFLFDSPEGTPTPPDSDAMGVFYLVRHGGQHPGRGRRDAAALPQGRGVNAS